MEFQPATAKHFFSYATKVSLELPPSWNAVGETDTTATYQGPAPGQTLVAPLLIVSVYPGAPTADTFERITKDFIANAGGGAVLRASETITVADFPGRRVAISTWHPQTERKIVACQAFIQVQQIVFGFSGVVEEIAGAAFTRLFDEAVQSVRFIPIVR